MTTTIKKLNSAAHLIRIQETTTQLVLLSAKTAHPAPITHQLIGTVLDNTVGLLTAPANSLDNGKRTIIYTEDHQWISLMQSVHRSFFSSIHLATESALRHICETNNLNVLSQQYQAMSQAIDLIQAAVENKDSLKKAFKVIKDASPKHPNFRDYLEAALSLKEYNTQFKKTWRKFFDALSIIRNKASHSDTFINENERKRLIEANFGTVISTEGILQFNTRIYEEVTLYTLQFLDLLTDHKT